MSRVAPTSGSKLLYFFFVCISGLLLYIDLNYKSFEGIKNSHGQRGKISGGKFENLPWANT